MLILNPQGEKVLELPDSCIEHRISQDGFIMQPEIGEIPATDRLMITSSVSENEATVGMHSFPRCHIIIKHFITNLFSTFHAE